MFSVSKFLFLFSLLHSHSHSHHPFSSLCLFSSSAATFFVLSPSSDESPLETQGRHHALCSLPAVSQLSTCLILRLRSSAPPPPPSSPSLTSSTIGSSFDGCTWYKKDLTC